jgi:GTPase SAR1 family protein
MHQDMLLYMNQGARENLRFSCWDFGGQDTFYSLHHLYMGRNSVFVLLFNMEWFLPDPERDGSKKQHLAFLAFWLNSIAAHAADPKDHSDMAPIILVGTFKDRVPSPEHHELISKMLDDTFKDTPAWSSVERRFTADTPTSGKVSMCFFPVDNTLGSKDSVITEIKKTIQEAVKKEKYIKKQVPFVWLKLLERVQEKDRPSCLKFDEVVKICQECGMQSTPGASVVDEAMAMLKMYNDLGQLMHHSEPTLRHLVILDPANYLVEPKDRVLSYTIIYLSASHILQPSYTHKHTLSLSLLSSLSLSRTHTHIHTHTHYRWILLLASFVSMTCMKT